MKKIFCILAGIIVLSTSVGPLVAVAQAPSATLFLGPASGSYEINKSFAVKVSVNSGGGVGINAAEGAIKFDPAYLSVAKLADTGSIFKLWTTNPSFSNSDGRITFGGGAPGAYTGNAGLIFTITFTAKKAGETNVTFSSGVILAADGKGTNVYSGAGSGKYTITEAKPAEEKPVEEKPAEVKGILPPLPEVSSPTHPNENIWYSNNDAEFTWKLLADLSGVSFIIDDSPATTPDNRSDGIIETERFEDIPDGIKYFHIKYQNKVGWGQTGHKKFLVDATPPDAFTITFDNEGDSTNPSPKLRFKTADRASGIDHYSVHINQEIVQVNPEQVAGGYYQLEPHAPGEYLVAIVAVDKAQNAASSSAHFFIDPLKAPIITSIPKVMTRQEELIIQGTSFYPRVTVKLYLSKSEKETIEAETQTDDNGNWSYFHVGRLDKANYQVWAKLVDERGAQSSDSAKHLVSVISPSIIESYGLYIIILLLIIITALVVYIFYQRKKFNEERRRIKMETNEVKDKLRKIFAALREEVDELIELADKKPGLSEAEQRIKEKLEESLDISEEFIEKEVNDIEKEINYKEIHVK